MAPGTRTSRAHRSLDMNRVIGLFNDLAGGTRSLPSTRKSASVGGISNRWTAFEVLRCEPPLFVQPTFA
jgi:hypothetical protein